MRVTSSELAFQTAHQRTDVREERVSIETWRAPSVAPRPDTVSLSQRAIQANAEAGMTAHCEPGSSGLGPALGLIKQVLEELLGVSIRVYRPEDYAPAATFSESAESASPSMPQRAPTRGAGLRITSLSHRSESEQLSLRAQGVVHTADGREIRIALQLDLRRSYEETSLTQISGGSEAPQRKDPLVINLFADGVQFDGRRIEFDLDADGVSELIPNVSAVSGFVAMDRNGNGQIDDGAELFGARSGDGFADLAAFGEDRNGWIDEADSAYEDVRIWRPDSETGADQVQTLAGAGVGALHVGSAESTFEYRDAAQAPVAELRATGLYLSESGRAGTLQQLDFFV